VDVSPLHQRHKLAPQRANALVRGLRGPQNTFRPPKSGLPDNITGHSTWPRRG